MATRVQKPGGRAFRHDNDDDIEREYDRLRDLARAEAEKRNSCFDRSRQAYNNKDGAAAKELSNQGKAHDQKMDDYNRQASDFIFRENNAPGRVKDDQIDLHGQFAEEGERIVKERIRADQARGQHHLHVIVGKGNHSTGHVQKLKPKIETLCSELGLKYRTEENAGRIFINLQGGEPYEPGTGAEEGAGHQDGGGYHRPSKPQGGRPPRPPHHQQQQQQNQQDDMAEMVEQNLPKILKVLQKHCCVVM